MRASARFQRWDEEVNLLKHEMQWTVAFFRHRKEKWTGLGEMEEAKSGLACYAFRQANVWEQFEKEAEDLFDKATTMVNGEG